MPEHHALIAFNVFVGSFFVHSTVMMRRQLLDAVGGYKPSQWTADDTELWSRLMWRTRFANLPEPLVLYRRHEAQQHTSPDATSSSHILGKCGLAFSNGSGGWRRMRPWRGSNGCAWRRSLAGGNGERLSQDMTRLMDAMINAGIIDPGDRGLVSAHIRRRLESTTPRLWQMFLHWRRHHFGAGKSVEALSLTENRAPLVSVVMPVYNGEKYLAEAIESILNQTFRDFEFVIVDDGSIGSDSAAIIRQLRRTRQAHSLYSMEQNQGEAAARNVGIAAARGLVRRHDGLRRCQLARAPASASELSGVRISEIGAIGVGTQIVNEDLSPLFAYQLPQCHAIILLSMMFGETAITRASIMARSCAKSGAHRFRRIQF